MEGPVVSEEKMFESVDWRMTNGCRSDWYTISSPGSGELKYHTQQKQFIPLVWKVFVAYMAAFLHIKYKYLSRILM